MAIRNIVQDFEFDSPKGLDTTSSIVALGRGYVREARNANVGLAGGYIKREGYTNQISTPYGSRDITAGIEYKAAAGTRKTIVFGTDNSGAGGRYGVLSGGSVSDITTGLNGTARPTFVQFGDLLFFYNGIDDPELYDGTNTRQVGITAPVSAPTGVAGGVGSLTAGNYVGAYTYYNSVTGAESTPSPLSNAVTAAGGDTITWTIVAGSSTTADTIRFYRTVANGNTLFLDGTAAIAATSYISTIKDAGLGDQIELDNSRITDLSSTAKFAMVADNRVFLRTANNEVRFSKQGQGGPMPESFEAKAVVSTMGKFGARDDVVGLNRISQTPVVLKNESVGRLDPVGIPDITSSADNVAFQYREISDTTGAVSHFAATQVLGELLWLAKDNIYATDGVQVRAVANTIQTTIRGLGFLSTQIDRMSAINDSENRRVYFSVFSSAAASDPDIILVGDYQMYPEFRWTTYEAGTDSSTHPGIKPASFFYVQNTSTGKQDVWFGNAVANGKAYRMNDGDTDDSSGIYFKIITRPYFMGQPMNEKLYKKASIQAQGDGADYGLTVCCIFDIDNQEQQCIDLTLFSNAALYDDASSLYDTSLYADEAVKHLEYDMHQKANYLQLVFKQTDANAPVELFAWSVAATGIAVRNRNETA